MSGQASCVRSTVVTLTLLGLMSCAVACGSSSAGESSTPSAQPPTTQAEITTTSPAPPTTTSPTTSTPSTTTSSPEESGEAEPSELTPVSGGQRLTLDRFFNADTYYWEEKRYDVATLSDVQGIASTVETCTSTGSNVRELELRLENKFEVFTFTAGQGNDSIRSDQNLSIEVLANNGQVEIRSIPFNEVFSPALTA